MDGGPHFKGSVHPDQELKGLLEFLEQIGLGDFVKGKWQSFKIQSNVIYKMGVQKMLYPLRVRTIGIDFKQETQVFNFLQEVIHMLMHRAFSPTEDNGIQ